MTAIAPEVLREERRSKRFTLISVALNLFFIAIAGTWLARSYFAPPPVVTVTIDRSAGARIERIARTLPPADAAIMRAAYRDNAAKLDASRAEVDKAVAEIKQSFRAEPFDREHTMRAMADARIKHSHFIELLHEEIALAASKMSPAGRARLAEYSSARVTVKPDR
jgi:uncharacterized membrane protein